MNRKIYVWCYEGGKRVEIQIPHLELVLPFMKNLFEWRDELEIELVPIYEPPRPLPEGMDDDGFLKACGIAAAGGKN